MLEEIVQRKDSGEIISNSIHNTPDSSSDFYKNTSLNELNYSKSTTFFTSRYESKLKEILSPTHLAEKDKPLSRKDLKRIQSQLDKFSKSEYEWKLYNKKAARDASLNPIAIHFKENFTVFQTIMDAYMFPSQETLKRSRKAHLNYFTPKFQKTINHLARNFEDLDVLNPILSLTKEDYKAITKDYICVEELFNNLLTIVINQAHDNLFRQSGSETEEHHRPSVFSDNVLVVLQHSLLYAFQKALAMFLLNAVLNYCNENKLLKVNITEISSIVHYQLYYKQYLFEYTQLGDNGWGLHSDNSATILQNFEKSGIYQEVLTEYQRDGKTGKPVTITKFVLPARLETNVLESLRVPTLVNLGKVKPDEVNKLLKPLAFGSGNVTKGPKLLKALSISRTKPYGISKLFLELCVRFQEVRAPQILYHLLENSKLEISFPTRVDIDNQRDIHMQALSRPHPNALHLYVATRLKNEFLGSHNLMCKNFFELLSLSQVSRLQSKVFAHKRVEQEKLNSLVLERKFADTSIRLAHLFKHTTNFVSDELDIRLRLYPKEFWVSRTRGGIKHLLCDAKPKRLTHKGFVYLFQAYYKADNVLSDKFKDFLVTIKSIKGPFKTKLYTFFDENYLDFEAIDEPLYFMNLHMELLQLRSNTTTSVNIEIDQTASGVVFLAYLLKSKEMAKACGLLNKSPSSPYDVLMAKCLGFLETHTDIENPKIIDFLTTNKKLHKYALMCFSYSQTYFGRMDDFQQHWVKTYKTYPTNSEREELNKFAVVYENFIEFVFPNTKRKLELLLEAVEVAVLETDEVNIRTLEGEKLDWTFYKYTVKKRAKFDPITRASKSYSVRVLNSKERKIDLAAHKRKFLAYLVHSIDSAVLRFFIREMKEKHGVSINHLHDCVIITPNAVDAFYSCVNRFYRKDFMFTMSKDLVFDPIRESLSKESQSKVDQIEAEFISLCDDFTKKDIDFDHSNLYKFES